VDSTPLLRKLESIGTLTDEERNALADLPGTVKNFAVNEDIVREGDRPSFVGLLLEGFLCRYAIVPSGKRQIMSFHIPGDIPDLQSLFIDVMDHSLAALVPAKVMMIPHGVMCGIIDHNPRIAHLLWRDTLIDAAVFRKWIAGIGRRSAYARIAHTFCEFVIRMKAVGLANEDSCELPFTQATIADALGLSTVHVNRTIQELRMQNLITLTGGRLTVRDWDGLQQAGEFDPAYLQLKGLDAAPKGSQPRRIA
jgi:CRP-like cAMP-binding protein